MDSDTRNICIHVCIKKNYHTFVGAYYLEFNTDSFKISCDKNEVFHINQIYNDKVWMSVI